MKKVFTDNLLFVGRNWSTMGANNTFENQEIEYKLTLHKIRFTWRSRIIEYKKNVSFCDKQIKGPY